MSTGRGIDSVKAVRYSDSNQLWITSARGPDVSNPLTFVHNTCLFSLSNVVAMRISKIIDSLVRESIHMEGGARMDYKGCEQQSLMMEGGFNRKLGRPYAIT
jgi:hypothetical protein